MLKSISISNLAVVHHLRLELFEGLNLLTGETGAGKSIIVDALGLLFGGRVTSEIIRTGEKRCVIESAFSLFDGQMEQVCAVLGSAGVELEANEDLLVRREIQANGRGRIIVNDQVVSAAVLKKIQPYVLDILGQGEQHSITSSKSHLDMLDNYAGSLSLRNSTAQAFNDYKKVADTLSHLRRDKAEKDKVGDYLRFQISEVERIDPKLEEYEELINERKLLVHAERALTLCSKAYNELYDDDQSIVDQLGSVRRDVDELIAIDPRKAEWVELLEEATVRLKDVSEAIRAYSDRFDFSPARLSEVEMRLADLERLMKKYGRDIKGIIQLKEDLVEELDQLESLDKKEGELEKQLEAAIAKYLTSAQRLSRIRKGAVPRFEKRVIEECKHLALDQSRFMISIESFETGTEKKYDAADNNNDTFTQREGQTGWGPSGIDRVEFYFSANTGEDAKPLARAASGGELSRLMLALRTVCHDSSTAGEDASSRVSLVFDEIDVGIGGRTAEAVGRRLKKLSANQQVICVTHQPQIARFADHHFKVDKSTEAGRTMTKVEQLKKDGRVGELARMIGGSEDIKATRDAARWMLENFDGDLSETKKEKIERKRKVMK